MCTFEAEMKRKISILIPVYNYDCTALVEELVRQTDGADCEIIVAEDGSTNPIALKANSAIAEMDRCRYLKRDVNVGRAAIRNLLARESTKPWLLFLDCDVLLKADNFVANYLSADESHLVVDGGVDIKHDDGLSNNLRYRYEKDELPRHSAEQRSMNPYRSFRTTNFMVSRQVMIDHPFDERFRRYGYEDVLFGKQLRQAGIGILHINNTVIIDDLEPNDVFVRKTEESLETLHDFRDDLRGYSRMITFAEGIHSRYVVSGIKTWHKVMGSLERRILCGKRPNLTIFKLYKLGYYLTLK